MGVYYGTELSSAGSGGSAVGGPLLRGPLASPVPALGLASPVPALGRGESVLRTARRARAPSLVPPPGLLFWLLPFEPCCRGPLLSSGLFPPPRPLAGPFCAACAFARGAPVGVTGLTAEPPHPLMYAASAFPIETDDLTLQRLRVGDCVDCVDCSSS